ncbi:MAG: SpoIID/LytB domain-containing protein, partial [Eubacteriales bacterium]
MTRKILATLLLCLATFPLPTVGATDLPQYVRAGLFYDDSQLVSANLENLDNFGAGYQFGYFDQKTNFVYLGETTHTQITMVRGGTVYRTGKDFSTSSGDQAMGGYHVIHSSPYNSYQEALTVAETLSGGFVAWINGEFQVRMGTFTSEANAKAVGSNVAQASATLINMVKSGTTELIFQFDGGSSYPFGVSPDVTGHSDPITWFKNIKYRGAFQYQRVSGGSLTVSNVVALDSYLKGVVPFEMSPSWPIEALKTQAVSARTYVTKQILSSTHGSSNFDVCNTAHCQVYYGTGGPSTSSPSVNSDSAVDQTSGMYLWYQDTLAGTYYSSSFGGGSESVYNVWRSSSVDAYPYLCGVVDPYEQLANSINYYSSWNLTFTTSELTTLLNGKGLGVGSSVSSLEAVYSDTGNVIELIIHWSSGRTNTLYPTEMRYSSWLALPSIHFTINQDLPSVS